MAQLEPSRLKKHFNSPFKKKIFNAFCQHTLCSQSWIYNTLKTYTGVHLCITRIHFCAYVSLSDPSSSLKMPCKSLTNKIGTPPLNMYFSKHSHSSSQSFLEALARLVDCKKITPCGLTSQCGQRHCFWNLSIQPTERTLVQYAHFNVSIGELDAQWNRFPFN